MTPMHPIYFIFSQYGILGQFAYPGARFCGPKLSVLLPAWPWQVIQLFFASMSLLSESEICSVVPNSFQPHGLYSPWNSPGQNTEVDSCSFLKGIFPTQGSNPGFLHCRRILYCLSHQGNPRILEWVAYPFFRGSSPPRNQTRVSI